MKLVAIFLSLTFFLSASDTIILNGLEWQDNEESSVSKKNWYEAEYYCKSLTLEGYNNWRLPTIRELQSIIDIYRYNPSIKKEFTFTNSKSFYWSSTLDASNNDKAWHVFYKYGDSYYSDKPKKYSVRCVRNQ